MWIKVLHWIFHQHRTGWVGQRHVDSQKSMSSSTEQQSREILLSAAAGSWLRSKPVPTKTPTTAKTQKTSVSITLAACHLVKILCLFFGWLQLRHQTLKKPVLPTAVFVLKFPHRFKRKTAWSIVISHLLMSDWAKNNYTSERNMFTYLTELSVEFVLSHLPHVKVSICTMTLTETPTTAALLHHWMDRKQQMGRN